MVIYCKPLALHLNADMVTVTTIPLALQTADVLLVAGVLVRPWVTYIALLPPYLFHSRSDASTFSSYFIIQDIFCFVFFVSMRSLFRYFFLVLFLLPKDGSFTRA